tara:strand:- start:1275 stop:1886 length:612 start_codon:yes stop_codon:yes gene_type:complete
MSTLKDQIMNHYVPTYVNQPLSSGSPGQLYIAKNIFKAISVIAGGDLENPTVSPSSEASTIQSTLVDAQVGVLKEYGNSSPSAISNPTIVITENTFSDGAQEATQAGEVSDPSSVVDEVLNYINNHKIGHNVITLNSHSTPDVVAAVVCHGKFVIIGLFNNATGTDVPPTQNVPEECVEECPDDDEVEDEEEECALANFRLLV